MKAERKSSTVEKNKYIYFFIIGFSHIITAYMNEYYNPSLLHIRENGLDFWCIRVYLLRWGVRIC